ncbi:DUF2797 domain-containing protein [Halalkalicoccus jeotgali]|uniref:DUF2797 domain-containing protein n=1 Tax=Halalkalicoccus jeotgali (strain DSM 18796 / CECT 7217 / JCM 14584 / KCTC 4019 / B3) TaxID=795797 RepID=D8J5D9_HALJB|nr:DUF2797 domain-containing protein [Halalkalicoccus jeotgali]ADJ15635.1 hypothetical protein HacjB3_11260 [Halalkalicoccus jeotgali B3]ELY36593.1 hypothetical protein C497_11398 [Halalkalicoccus jeotgali B3]
MQIVGYETGAGDGEAALLLAAGNAYTRKALAPDVRLDYALGDRRCAGTLSEGTHVECSNPAAPYCEDHSYTWVCARCTGTCLKAEMDCFEEHAVYLAAFAPATFKVGVTRAWRLDTRLREQGADRAAHLHTVSNGRIAREIESEIAREVGDSVRVPTKIRGLASTVDLAAWEAFVAEYDPIETIAFEYGLDLTGRPVSETIASGRVLGTKGRILVLERDRTTYAVDLRDLVGYEVREGAPERSLQSSLGAFESG